MLSASAPDVSSLMSRGSLLMLLIKVGGKRAKNELHDLNVLCALYTVLWVWLPSPLPILCSRCYLLAMPLLVKINLSGGRSARRARAGRRTRQCAIYVERALQVYPTDQRPAHPPMGRTNKFRTWIYFSEVTITWKGACSFLDSLTSSFTADH